MRRNVVASWILTFVFSPNHPHAGGVEFRVGDGGSRRDRIDFADTIGAVRSRAGLAVDQSRLDARHQVKRRHQSAAENSNDAELLGNNGHGDVYVLRFQLETERGAASVLSAWIIRDYEDFPRLITCYILQL